MDGVTEDVPAKIVNDLETESATNFQKFVYDLFEKNGVLNDLRAYLRGHIVDVLKSAQTGVPPLCQRHFTQRLELTNQALNMLVAEYLLRMEFSYSLSVFVSEIPLANMVIGFAETLMQTNDGNFRNLRFKENDIWSILNYLGVKCDSEHASNIVAKYNSKKDLSLLQCILDSLPMYQREIKYFDPENLSSASLSSSLKTSEGNIKQSRKNSRIQGKCRHYVFCKICQSKMEKVKQKYKEKKYKMAQNIKSPDEKPLYIETFMRNISAMEKSLVDEMFQQLKSVYEAEMEMMKQDEEKKLKKSLASHLLLLQKKRDEMEESFKMREAELEGNVQEKKKFLWGLAQALRDQHRQMARAMHAVRHETERLSAKEDSLKTQLLEAEEVLRNRGEDMRRQISEELIILESHVESMKKERDSISRERSELENLKSASNNPNQVIKVHDLTNEELISHYDLLKDELSILKKYLETTKLQPKCVIDRSTLTDLNDVTSKVNVLNNEQQLDRAPKSDSEDRIRTPNKVVNDLKKQKNVNFSTSKVEELYRERSRSSVSTEAGNAFAEDEPRNRELVERLREENERLKTFARQQREHIDELTSYQARLRAELTAARFRHEPAGEGYRCPRPRTAPSQVPPPIAITGPQSVRAEGVGWCRGAGEEISVFSNARPRIVLPGDTLPFVGVIRDRHCDNRRYLINQWRALRRRTSPIAVGKLGGVTCKGPSDVTETADPALGSIATIVPTHDEAISQINETFQNTQREKPKTPDVVDLPQPREKSPKSVLREAKEKLRNHTDDERERAPRTCRDDSPGSVLREARRRLRRLEIEAEAVERSYLDYRRRRDRDAGRSSVHSDVGELDIGSLSQHKRQEHVYRAEVASYSKTELADSARLDIDKYLRAHQDKVDDKVPFNNNSSVKHQPTIQKEILKFEEELKNTLERCDNFLETPLSEFRKLYHSEKSVFDKQKATSEILNTEINKKAEGNIKNDDKSLDSKSDSHTNKGKNLDEESKKPENSNENIMQEPLDLSNFSPIKKKNEQDEPADKDDLTFEKDVHESMDLKSISLIKNTKNNQKQLTERAEDEENENSVQLSENISLENKIKDKENEFAQKSEGNKENSVQASLHSKSLSLKNKVKNKQDEFEILKDNINKMYNMNQKMASDPSIDNIDNEKQVVEELKHLSDTNIENIGDSSRDLVVVVESSVDTEVLSEEVSQHENISTQMTIIVSPKRSSPIREAISEKSFSPRVAEKMTKNDALDDIFHADASNIKSSVEMQLNISNDVIETEEEKVADDYPDDFSADVDNYNSRSEYENHSPISLPKSSEDDNFWES